MKLQLERKSATAITMVKPDAIISALAGTYQLLNITIFRAGVPVPVDPYGTKGLLIYTRTGYVTAILTSWARSDLPDNGNNMTWPHVAGNDEGWAIVGRDSLAYAGKFTIDPAVPSTQLSGGILHGPLDVSTSPTLLGNLVARNYTVVRQKGANGGVYVCLYAYVPYPVESFLWWKKVD